jgi:hypothetical protein
MATFTETQREGGKFATATAIPASDVSTLNVKGFNKLRASATPASFGSGAITMTVTASVDGTHYVALTTFASITAAGNYDLVALGTAVTGLSVQTASPTLLDITGYNFLRFTRGADSNTGTVALSVDVARTAGRA